MESLAKHAVAPPLSEEYERVTRVRHPPPAQGGGGSHPRGESVVLESVNALLPFCAFAIAPFHRQHTDMP